MQSTDNRATRHPRWLALQLYIVAGLVLLTWLAKLPVGATSTPLAAPPPLDEFPLQVDDWTGVTDRFSSGGIPALDIDDWELRRYHKASGDFVWFYMGFLNRQTSQRNHHSPQLCYPAQGWEIQQRGLHPIPLPTGDKIEINQLVLQKGVEKRVVLYWFQQGDQIVAEPKPLDMSYNIMRVARTYTARLTAVWQGNSQPSREESVLIRVSAPVVSRVEETLAREVDFIQSLFPSVAQHFRLDVAAH